MDQLLSVNLSDRVSTEWKIKKKDCGLKHQLALTIQGFVYISEYHLFCALITYCQPYFADDN